MTPAEREIITDLKLCDFREIMVYFKEQSEKKKAMSKEEKQVLILAVPSLCLKFTIFREQ